ncbi:MAG: LysR family transcriptional regulator, partial [Alicyclobacillus sp.]|nr:LysR family transcriptional regulator [Alicyclobacillus sp.]
MNMELKNIEAFLMVVKMGSFSAAANALFISQPAISVRIQQLEQELDIELFKRENGKKITLTESGRRLYPFFEEAFALIERGLQEVKSQSPQRIKVRIACPNHMGVQIMPEILKVLYEQFPTAEFPLKVSDEGLLDDFERGDVDLGFTYVRPKGLRHLSVVKVADEQNILVCCPNHALAHGERVTLSDLQHERIIVYHREWHSTKLIHSYLKRHHLQQYKQVEISNVGWLKMMVRKGLGVAFLQNIIVQEELESGKLVQLNLQQ